MPLDYPRDGAARCGDIIIYSARTSPPLNPMRPSPALSAALLRPRAPSPRWTPPPPRSSTSSSSSSSPTSSSYASGPPPWGSARGTAGARRPAWSAALLRPRAPSPRWTPPPPRSSTSSSSSSTSTSSSYASSSMHGAARAGAACVAERWRGAVDLLEFFGVAAPWRWPRRSSSA